MRRIINNEAINAHRRSGELGETISTFPSLE
jgi:hypothetical protein